MLRRMLSTDMLYVKTVKTQSKSINAYLLFVLGI